VEGRLLIHRGFTGHACRPHEKSGLVVAIAVEETLKGVPKDSLRILLSWCGGGSAEVADEVVAFRLGEKWHIKASLSEVAEARKALTNQ